MASSNVKFRLCLFGFTLFLACVSVGLGAESESLSSGAGADHGCVSKCEGLRGKNADEFAACVKGCGVNQEVSPRMEYAVCRLKCHAEEHGAEHQRCQQLCEKRLREREQHEGRGKDDDEVKRRDPEREREEQREREHEQEERRRHEHERERERGRGRRDENERDPEREREERRREEQHREQEREHRREQERRERERRGERDEEDDGNQRDPEWRKEHERREQEQERRREQERRERERRGERDEEDDGNKRDPEWRKEHERREQEQERRREQERRERERRGERDDENQRDPHWRREQERKEQERRRREQEHERRERERRGGRDDEDDVNQRDPDWRREQERKEQERRRREQEQERRERERRGERDDEDDVNQRDPDWRREQERKEQERRRREQEQERERRGERDDENQRDPDWRREHEHKEQERHRREQERREREREREHGRRGGRDENQRGGGGREEQRSREEEREREEQRRERQHGRKGRANQEEMRRTEQEQSHNPYYFQEQQFQSRFKSDEGHWRVLERFSERSELLKGIKNQRLAILEARPQTFIIPHHLDAESVLLVVRGKATITTIVQEKKETKKESYNVERGDVMTVPAGTTLYLANHENEDLQIVKLIQPVNNPSQFKDYLSAGGEAQSYYSVFSNDVLEAALNIPRDRLESIFKQKGERRGKIIKASQEQLKALSQRATSVRKGSRGTRAPIKLESQTPVYRNQFGQMFEACPDEFPQLRRTDVAAAVLDIEQGGMMVPHFNSRATWVVFISEGTGSFEMACPHVQGGQWQRGSREEERHGRREEEERSDQIERVSGRLSQGGVLVIPAGHPIAIMASPNENLRLVGFGINAENNQRNFLAGKENIMNEVDREAKELAFNVERKQAEETFKSQKESFFTAGPEGGRRRSTQRSPLLSIMKLTGYF